MTLEIFIEDDPSPVIKLDQQEQEVGPWTILPLSSPPKVSAAVAVVLCSIVHTLLWLRSLKLLSRTTKSVEESLTVVLSYVYMCQLMRAALNDYGTRWISRESLLLTTSIYGILNLTVRYYTFYMC